MTQTTKLGFIADSHLRTSQYGSAQRGHDFLNAVLSAIHVAHAEGITTILHGGDLLDTAKIDGPVFAQLRHIDDLLKELGMRMLAITGNHDMSHDVWHNQLNPESCFKLQEDGSWDVIGSGLFCIDYKLVNVGELKVLGLPFMLPSKLRDTLEIFPQLHPGKTVDILMWHGVVKEFLGFSGDDAIRAEDFSQHSYITNVMLGDIHARKFYALRGNTGGKGIIGYPGSTEMCKSDEETQKSITVLSALAPGSLEVSALPITTRPFWRRHIASETAMQSLLAELQAFKGAFGPVVCAVVTAEIEQFSSRVRAASPMGTLLLDPRVMSSLAGATATFDLSSTGEVTAEAPTDLVGMIRTVLPGVVADADFEAFAAITRNPDAAEGILRARVAEITTNN